MERAVQQKSWHLDKSAGGRQANESKRAELKALLWQGMPGMTGVRSPNFELFHSKLKEKSFIFLSSKWLGAFHVCKLANTHIHDEANETKRKEKNKSEEEATWKNQLDERDLNVQLEATASSGGGDVGRDAVGGVMSEMRYFLSLYVVFPLKRQQVWFWVHVKRFDDEFALKIKLKAQWMRERRWKENANEPKWKRVALL